MYEWVIFDVDGTLIDTEKANVVALQKLLLEENVPWYSEKDLKFIMGLTGEDALRRLGIENVVAVNKRWNQYIKAHYHLVKVFVDIEFMLRELLKRGCKTGIVTSKTHQELEDDLDPFELGQYFSHATCADDTQRHKPDPEPLVRFSEHAKVDPKRALYIGDTENDLLAACGAGIDFGLAVWGAGYKDLPDSRYHFISPREIIKVATEI